jgi:hypothetical protein
MPTTFKRDRFFWTVAAQTAVVNFFLGGFGPAQSLLNHDQKTALWITGLHGTAMGVASILSGMSLPHLAHRYGRSNTFHLAWLHSQLLNQCHSQSPLR